jgi:flagellar basal-body rod protein FlgC
MDSIFDSLEISATGLSAERFRMNTIANNIANANTVSSTDEGAYRRKSVVFRTMTDDSFYSSFSSNLQECGVEVKGIVEDKSKPQLKYEPGHPDADENGFIRLSNVNVLNEMVDMISATRAYEANITAIDSSKSMVKKAINIGNY